VGTGVSDGGERDSLAPVIPLFGGPVPAAPPSAAEGEWADAATPQGEPAWNSTWADDVESSDDDPFASEGRGGDDTTHLRAATAAETADEARQQAEKTLLKKLRARSLSVREARAVLREHGLDDDTSDEMISSFERLGYLDDARLAEQLVHSGSDRKGQGRKAIAQTLAKRGLARDVADTALDELPDDDFERALEFSRSKAGSMRGLERDVALRRLAGQLARRGYGGPVAMTAARQALDELSRPVGRVRFE
jgi:regulatory protein